MSLLIINHHYFRSKKLKQGIYPITPDELKIEIKKLNKYGWILGSQEKLFEFKKRKFKNFYKLALLTFDDGLKEQLNAAKQLSSINIFPVFFVPTLPYTDEKVLPVHKLHMIRAQISDVELLKTLEKKFHLNNIKFDEDFLKTQYRYDNEISRRVKYFLNFILDTNKRNDWLNHFFKSTFGDEKKIVKQLYFSKEELRFLAEKNQLGSHAHSHVPLSLLDEKNIKKELLYSRQILGDITGYKVCGISYPYGGKSSVDDKVFKLAKKCGYKYGLTMKRGLNHPKVDKSMFCLNRIDVNDLNEWL